MRLITATPDVCDWAAAQIPYMYGSTFEKASGFGIVSNAGELVGAVIFTSWHPEYASIEASFVFNTPKCLTRSMVQTILDYPFGQLGCQRVTTVTPRKLRPARRFLEKFGFKREGLVRKGFGKDDAVISGLLSKEWMTSRFRKVGDIGQEINDGSSG